MQCNPVLDALKTRSQDPEFKQYIQRSNGACNYATRTVCCPSGPIAPPPVDLGGKARLLTPEEGCGFSNVTHPKVVGGVPAMIGGWPWMALVSFLWKLVGAGSSILNLSLQVGYKNDFGDVSFKCGGTLISTQHVLTG